MTNFHYNGNKELKIILKITYSEIDENEEKHEAHLVTYDKDCKYCDEELEEIVH